MALISCHRLRIDFGGHPLLDDANLQIERGERVGLLGRNGEGKSTLLKVILGSLTPAGGDVVRETGARLSMVDQQMPEDLSGSALQVIASGGAVGEAPDHEAERMCSLLRLEPHGPFESLSGGQKRRALIGRALVSEPDVLLLDEPTNHLDLDHIELLETLLLRFRGSVLFVTHDRAFLQRVATRIVELDRGRLTSWDCDYPTFLERKEEVLANEVKEWDLFDQKLAKEESWIRRGIKARRTRNEGRVRALEQLRRERTTRRERVGQVRLTVQEGGRAARKVVEAKKVSFGYGGTPAAEPPVIADLTTTIHRGDKVGIIGPNGCGKTTLLKLLLGVLHPEKGSIRHGGKVEVAYFDQLRDQLDGGATLADAVADGNEYVTIGDERRHIYSYLDDFLFSAELARQPVSTLSGGERNRLLLAKLFTQPANVLVLDEPTNDLDTDTLELLEAQLLAYNGTVLVVSHDRAFLDNLCTNTLVYEGEGRFKEYVGGYSDWKRTVEQQATTGSSSRASRRSQREAASRGDAGSTRPAKLSYEEKKEWAALPGHIEKLEQELEGLQQRLADPAFFKGDAVDIKAVTQRTKAIPEEIERAFERWGALDERK